MKHLQRALDGQNQWWKYLVVLFIALVIGQMIGAIPLFLVMTLNPNRPDDFVQPENNMDFSAYGINPVLGLALMVIPFIVTLFITMSGAQGLHKRHFKDIVNGGGAIRWNRMVWGFAVWFVLIFAFSVIAIWSDPDNFELRYDASSFIPLVIIAFLFIPFQAATEEVLFRGYLAQGIAGFTKRPWLVILIPSLLFALMHVVNPEVKEYGFWIMMPQYFIVGLVYAIISVLDDGIELAIGLHAANNVFLSIFVTADSSVLQTPALFLQKEIDPIAELWSVIITSILLLAVLIFIFKWDFKVLFKKIKPIQESQLQPEMKAISVEN